ncbi:hypothetical protein [Caenimonas sp. SL110]|uniref:hypothetical protein n=1 Tax=Caenimonas sp. SL110 TaxID=1450524 RepID=UPI00128B0211|nr:hypothetical protein [Caenimonas sp. SL110]
MDALAMADIDAWPEDDDFPPVSSTWPMTGSFAQCCARWGPQWAHAVARISDSDPESLHGVVRALLRSDDRTAHKAAIRLVQTMWWYQLHENDLPQLTADVINAACGPRPIAGLRWVLPELLARIDDADIRARAALPMKLMLLSQAEQYQAQGHETSYDCSPVEQLIEALDTCPGEDAALVERLSRKLPGILATLSGNFTDDDLRQSLGMIRLFFHHPAIALDLKEQLASALAHTFCSAALEARRAGWGQMHEFVHLVCLSALYLSCDTGLRRLAQVLPGLAAAEDLLMAPGIVRLIIEEQAQDPEQTGLLLAKILKRYGMSVRGQDDRTDKTALLTFLIDPDGLAVQPDTQVRDSQNALNPDRLVGGVPVSYLAELAARREVLHDACARQTTPPHAQATAAALPQVLALISQGYVGTSVQMSDWPGLLQTLFAARAAMPEIPWRLPSF